MLTFHNTIPLSDLPETVAVDRESLDRYVGRYELTPQMAFDIRRVEDNLTVQLSGQSAYTLYAASETSFFLTAVEARVEFELDGRDVVALVLHQGGRSRRAARVD